MAESLFASLLHTLDKRSISEIAGSLGESEHSVSKGMETSIGAVLGGLASKSEDSGFLRRMLDLVPGNSGDISWSHLATSLSNPASPLIAGGKRILSGIFGAGDHTVTNIIGRESGVSSSTAGTLLAMAAPMVMSFLGKRVRDESLSMTGLGALLQREAGAIRSALPPGLSDLFWPRTGVAAPAASPVVAQGVRPESNPWGWVAAIALGAIALGCFWWLSHARRPIHVTKTVTGTASRMADEVEGLGHFVVRRLPNNVTINVPEYGVESRMLGFVQDPNAPVNQGTWFDFDRLTFDSGSANLRPESREQLDNIAAIFKAYPNVHAKVAGYTDSVGSAERNMELSQARADRVKTELVSRGVSPDCLTAEGLGEQNAAAANSTAGGRAQNRRVTLLITQK